MEINRFRHSNQLILFPGNSWTLIETGEQYTACCKVYAIPSDEKQTLRIRKVFDLSYHSTSALTRSDRRHYHGVHLSDGRHLLMVWGTLPPLWKKKEEFIEIWDVHQGSLHMRLCHDTFPLLGNLWSKGNKIYDVTMGNNGESLFVSLSTAKGFVTQYHVILGDEEDAHQRGKREMLECFRCPWIKIHPWSVGEEQRAKQKSTKLLDLLLMGIDGQTIVLKHVVIYETEKIDKKTISVWPRSENDKFSRIRFTLRQMKAAPHQQKWLQKLMKQTKSPRPVLHLSDNIDCSRSRSLEIPRVDSRSVTSQDIESHSVFVDARESGFAVVARSGVVDKSVCRIYNMYT